MDYNKELSIFDNIKELCKSTLHLKDALQEDSYRSIVENFIMYARDEFDFAEGCVDFDMENFDDSSYSSIDEDSGIEYVKFNSGGDWQYPVDGIFYYHNNKYWAYVPKQENTFNPLSNAAFGEEGDIGWNAYDMDEKGIDKRDKLFEKYGKYYEDDIDDFTTYFTLDDKYCIDKKGMKCDECFDQNEIPYTDGDMNDDIREHFKSLKNE